MANNDNVTVIDIVAQVTDQTGPGAASATQSVTKLEQTAKRVQGEVDKMKKMGKIELSAHLLDKASNGIQSIMSMGKKLAGTAFNITFKAVDLVTRPLRGIIGGVKSVVSGILNPILQGMGMSAGMGLSSLISESINNAGHTETANIAMNAVSRSTGTDIDLVNEQKRAVMSLGIAEQEATGIMTQFMQAELDVAQAAKIARVAQDAAVIAGTNSSEAAATMVDAISSLNPKLLKQFGMTKNMSSILDDYAEGIGIVVKTTDKYGKSVRHMTRDLTEAEQKQAMLNYVLEEGEKISGTYEDAMSSPFKKLGSMKRYVSTLFEKIGTPLFLPLFGDAVDSTTGLLKTAIDWADNNKDLLENWGQNLASWFEKAASKVSDFGNKVKDIFSGEDFQNADLLGKVKILWNRIVADPFDEWWNGTGKSWLAGKADEMGRWLGSSLKTGILTLLGVDAGEAFEDGLSIGRSFGSAFAEGFDADTVMGAVWDAIKGFINANPLTASLFIGAKTLPAVSKGFQIVNGVKGVASGVKAGGASNALAGLGGAAAVEAVGGILAAAGLVSAATDLANAASSFNEKEKRDSYTKAAVKGGMVLGGATIGTLILPGLGTAIGGGLGGLAALIFGDSAGQALSDWLDGTALIRDTTSNLQEATTAYQEAINTDLNVQKLIERYEAIDKAMKDGSISAQDMATAQAEMKGIVRELADIYPDLIGQYEIENGVLGTKLGLLQNISEQERKRRKIELETLIIESEKVLSGAGEKYAQSLQDYEEYDNQYKIYDEAYGFLRKEKSTLGSMWAEIQRIPFGTEEYEKATDSFNRYLADVEKGLQAINPELLDYTLQGTGLQGVDTILSELDKNRGKANSAKGQELNTQSMLIGAAEARYGAQKKILEGEMGDTYENLAKNFHQLDTETQTALLTGIDRLEAFTRSMDLIPDSLEIELKVWANLMENSWPAFTPKVLSRGPLTAHAEGGIMTRPHMGLVAEDGAEAIIPLSGNRRSRGLALWERVGEMLGIRPYAEGGIIGTAMQAHTAGPIPLWRQGNDYGDAANTPDNKAPFMPSQSGGEIGGVTPVIVDMGDISIDVHVADSDADANKIAQTVREAVMGMLDDIAQKIAVALEQVYSNMTTV